MTDHELLERAMARNPSFGLLAASVLLSGALAGLVELVRALF